jgi:hypothetical protein
VLGTAYLCFVPVIYAACEKYVVAHAGIVWRVVSKHAPDVCNTVFVCFRVIQTNSNVESAMPGHDGVEGCRFTIAVYVFLIAGR